MQINNLNANNQVLNLSTPNGLSKTDVEKTSFNVADNFEKSVPEEENPSFWGKLQKKVLGGVISTLNFPALSVAPMVSDERREKILSLVQPGDIILETNANYPTWQIMEKIAGGSDYTHAAIYEGDGKFLEATTGHESGFGVGRTDLREYLQGRLDIQILRPPYKSKEDIDAALDYARSQIGKPYDSAFDYSEDEKQYCAEYVAKALKAMPNPIDTPTFQFLGREVVLPNDFKSIKGVESIYDDGASIWKTQLQMAPALAGGVALGAAGGMLLGPVGAVVGFVAGTIATTVVGGKLQEKELDELIASNKQAWQTKQA